MPLRALALSVLVSCSAALLVAASSCTNGATPVCTGDAGCGPGVDNDALLDDALEGDDAVPPDSPDP